MYMKKEDNTKKQYFYNNIAFSSNIHVTYF